MIWKAVDRIFAAREGNERIARGPGKQNRATDLRADVRLIGFGRAKSQPRLFPDRGAFGGRVDNPVALCARGGRSEELPIKHRENRLEVECVALAGASQR